MKIIEPGHVYQLQHLDGSGAGMLVFVNREPGTEHEGTQTQEVLRALIDRTQHCDRCLRWDGNDKIIHHLRMALALHEARALERKTEKGVIAPEVVATAKDGHFALVGGARPTGARPIAWAWDPGCTCEKKPTGPHERSPTCIPHGDPGMHAGPCECWDGCGACDGCGRYLMEPNKP